MSLKFQQHFSGSKGNLYEITAINGKRLIIECGMPLKKIFKAIDHKTKGIEGCFVSHSHFDHSKSIKEIVRTGLNVYANESTLSKHGLTGRRKVTEIKNKDLVKLPSFTVYCFDVNHSVPNLGFVINETATNEKLLFVTDARSIPPDFKKPTDGGAVWKFGIICIEVNYDERVLNKRVDDGKIDRVLADSILDSHMGKKNAMRYLKNHVDMSKCHELHLLHMSDGNIDAERTREEFKSKFFIDVKIVGD